MVQRALGLVALLLLLSPGAGARAEEPDYARPGLYFVLGGNYATNVGGTEYTAIDTGNPNDPGNLTNIKVNGSMGGNARLGYRFFPHLTAEVEIESLPGFDSLADLPDSEISQVITCGGGRFINTGGRPLPGPPTVLDEDSNDITSEAGPCLLDPKETAKSEADFKRFVGQEVPGARDKNRRGQLKRTTGLIVATVNAKVPILTGRFQPYGIVGLGVYYAGSKSFDSGLDPLGLSNSDVGFAAKVGGGFDIYFSENIALTGEVTWLKPVGLESLPIDDPSFVNTAFGILYQF